MTRNCQHRFACPPGRGKAAGAAKDPEGLRYLLHGHHRARTPPASACSSATIGPAVTASRRCSPSTSTPAPRFIRPVDAGVYDTPDAAAPAWREAVGHSATGARPAPADPALWIAEVQADRAIAVAALGRTEPSGSPRRRLTRQQIKDLVDGLGGLLTVLGEADPADKAEVYRQLGLRLTYDHETETVVAEASPRSSVCVVSVSEGGLEPKPNMFLLTCDLDLAS